MLSAQTILSFLELPRVGRKTAWKLVELAVREGLADRDLEDFSGCRDFIAQASEVVSRVSVPDKVETQNAIAQASRIIEELDSYNDEQEDSRVELIGYCDEAYPSRLKDLAEDAPVVLFCRGDRAALDPAQAIAVIGTRNPSDKATEAAHRVGELLARGRFHDLGDPRLDEIQHSWMPEYRRGELSPQPLFEFGGVSLVFTGDIHVDIHAGLTKCHLIECIVEGLRRRLHAW